MSTTDVPPTLAYAVPADSSAVVRPLRRILGGFAIALSLASLAFAMVEWLERLQIFPLGLWLRPSATTFDVINSAGYATTSLAVAIGGFETLRRGATGVLLLRWACLVSIVWSLAFSIYVLLYVSNIGSMSPRTIAYQVAAIVSGAMFGVPSLIALLSFPLAPPRER